MRNSLPTLYRHRATGRAYTRIQTSDGRRDIYFGAFGTPAARAAYHRFLAAYLLNGRDLPQRQAAEPPARTVNEHITKYLVWLERRSKSTFPGSHAEPIRSALAVLHELFGDDALAAVDPKVMAVVKAEMIRRGASEAEAAEGMMLIEAALKWPSKSAKG